MMHRRYLGLFFAAVTLGGCAAAQPDSLIGIATEATSPGAREAYEAAQDDKKCRSFGYSSEASQFYGQCRMQLQQLRAASKPAVVVVR
jgi:hypothetical protein